MCFWDQLQQTVRLLPLSVFSQSQLRTTYHLMETLHCIKPLQTVHLLLSKVELWCALSVCAPGCCIQSKLSQLLILLHRCLRSTQRTKFFLIRNMLHKLCLHDHSSLKYSDHWIEISICSGASSSFPSERCVAARVPRHCTILMTVRACLY